MTSYLLNLCFASASSHLLFNDRRLIRRGRAFVVSSSRRPTSSPSRQFRQRRWRSTHADLFRKKPRLLSLPVSSLQPPASSSPLSSSAGINVLSPDFLHSVALTLASHTETPHRPNPIDLAAVEHLFELSTAHMEAQAHPVPRPRVGSHASSGTSGSSASSASSASSGMSDGRYSESMPPPPLPASTSQNGIATGAATAANGSAANRASTESQDGWAGGHISRSVSAASRNNRLSLTLPISLSSNSITGKPASASSAGGSYPATPHEPLSALASPSEPTDFIQAIASEERRVLELREELSRTEKNLVKLKRQWANKEVLKKRTEMRRFEQMRPMSTRNSTKPAADSQENGASEDPSAKRMSELDRRKLLLLSQQNVPSTPTHSRRRVFTGRHTRALSLLSPTKTSSSDSFPMLDGQADDEMVRSPISPESDSPFYQQLSRIAPTAAAQLSKRASWAPQSGQQVFKQAAGDLSATLWTFVEDLRQATVGDEPINGGPGSAMRAIDGNIRNGDNAVTRAGRPNGSRVVSNGDVQGTPTPGSRHVSVDHQKKGKAGSNGKAAKSTKEDAKPAKRFSWAPLTVDQYDDSEWASWDSPTVKSPRWSGSTANGDAAGIVEEENENATPVKRYPTSQTPPRNNRESIDIDWPAALKQLSPGNIKRTATDFMKEWEKSLAEPDAFDPAPASTSASASTSRSEAAKRTTNA